MSCSTIATVSVQFLRGLLASLRLTPTLRLLAKSRSARTRFRNIIILNLSLIALDVSSTLRVLQSVAGALTHMLIGAAPAEVNGITLITDTAFSALFYVFAVVPVLLAAVVLTGRWVRQVVTATNSSAPAQGRGSRPGPSRPGSGGSSYSAGFAALGEPVFQASLLLIMTLQAAIIDFLPFLGRPLALVLTAIITGFSAYDVGRWAVVSAPTRDRLAALEVSWPWFAGFGTITAAMSYFCSVGVNMGVFGLSYPFLVLAAFGEHDSQDGYAPPTLNETQVAWARGFHIFSPFKWSVLQVARLLNWCWRRRSNWPRRSG